MNKKLKLHIQKYIFYDVFFFIIFIGISYIIFRFYNDYQENKKSRYDFSIYNDTLIEMYDIDPTIFEFNEDNIAIVEMNTLIEEPITDGKQTMHFGEIPINENQDQCVGYIIIKKENEEFSFDYSHLCDMVDH